MPATLESQKQHATWEYFGRWSQLPLPSMPSPQYQLQVCQLIQSLLILVLHVEEQWPLFWKNSLSKESSYTSGSCPMSSPSEEPLDTPNPNTFALSEMCLMYCWWNSYRGKDLSNSVAFCWSKLCVGCRYQWDAFLILVVCVFSPTHNLSLCTACAFFDILIEVLHQFLLPRHVVDHASKCNKRWSTIFYYDISADCFHYCVLLVGNNSLTDLMTSIN